jgi:hypothetical protein
LRHRRYEGLRLAKIERNWVDALRRCRRQLAVFLKVVRIAASGAHFVAGCGKARHLWPPLIAASPHYERDRHG